jgi:hypothetical protein
MAHDDLNTAERLAAKMAREFRRLDAGVFIRPTHFKE